MGVYRRRGARRGRRTRSSGSWLGKQFRSSEHVLVKDPRLSWFLPLWRRCAEEAGVSPRFATVLRHPAAVIDSKQRSYGHWQSDVSRTAGWLNQTLFTERATRESPRVFVRYEDLLDDWTRIVGRVGETLDLAVVRDAPAASIVSIHEFVDKGLSRSKANWEDFAIPTTLREQVDVVWDLVSQLAEEIADDMDTLAQELEAARAAYVVALRGFGGDRAVLDHGRPPQARFEQEHGGGTLLRLADKVPARLPGEASAQLAQGRLPREARRRKR